MTAVPISHIALDKHARPWIAGTRIKVIEVAMDKIAYGWGPEEIQRQHPHLSLAQVHAALSYYYDHQIEMDAQIMTSLQRAEHEHSAAVGAGRQMDRKALELRLRQRGKAG